MYQSIHPSVNRTQCESYRWNKYVLKTFVRSICLIIAGYTCDREFPVAQNRISVTRHEGRTAEIGCCLLGRPTEEIHPQDRYGSRERFSEKPKNA
jgi:hypothetical protein